MNSSAESIMIFFVAVAFPAIKRQKDVKYRRCQRPGRLRLTHWEGRSA
jgi:hypothetical protein